MVRKYNEISRRHNEFFNELRLIKNRTNEITVMSYKSLDKINENTKYIEMSYKNFDHRLESASNRITENTKDVRKALVFLGKHTKGDHT